MIQLIVGRALFSLGTLLFVGLVLFALTRAGPGSPARIVLGADATVEAARENWRPPSSSSREFSRAIRPY